MHREVNRESIFTYTAVVVKHILELKQVSFKYPDYPGLEFPYLFSDIDLALEEGDFRVVLGKPESGKTTLARIITGLVPRYTGGSLSGTVFLEGKNTASLKPYELLEQCGSVFQNPDEQILMTRCDSEIAFPMESLGWERAKMERLVTSALKSTDILPLKPRNPATLSGGEKKKLLLSSLFALDPRLWILDESLDELDPVSVTNIVKHILEKGRTILLLASKYPGVPGDIPVRYSVFSQGKLLHQENMSDTDFEKLLEREGIALPKSDSRWILPVQTGTSPGETVLQMKDVHYSYPGNSGFSLHVDDFTLHTGETVSVVGKNGSGKSTLGKLLSGLVLQDSGEIRISREGQLRRADPQTLNACTGYLFQNPDSQIFLSSVREELSFNHPLEEQELSRILGLFSLPGRDVPPALMSYGARKRLQGAIYYLLDKKLYIIDEADAGLSMEDFSNIITLLREKGTALIIITHNLELSRLFSHRTYIMEGGSIINSVDNGNFSRVQTYFTATTEDHNG